MCVINCLKNVQTSNGVPNIFPEIQSTPLFDCISRTSSFKGSFI